MKKTTALALAVLLAGNFASAAPAGVQAAKHFHHMKGSKSELPRGFDRLNLSEEQKAKIKAIVEADRQGKQAHHAQQREQRRQQFRQNAQTRLQQERALLGSKQFDEQAARKMIAERRQARLADEVQRTERELQMLKKRHAIFQVLTPAQQQQYQNMQDEMRQGRYKSKSDKGRNPHR